MEVADDVVGARGAGRGERRGAVALDLGVELPLGRGHSVGRCVLVDDLDRGSRRDRRRHGVLEALNVDLGPAAGDFYPVLDGLSAGERIVTVGTFLVDAENRLNPTKMEPQMNTDKHR